MPKRQKQKPVSKPDTTEQSSGFDQKVDLGRLSKARAKAPADRVAPKKRKPATKRQPKEDFNQATSRVFQEVIRRSEAIPKP